MVNLVHFGCEDPRSALHGALLCAFFGAMEYTSGDGISKDAATTVSATFAEECC